MDTMTLYKHLLYTEYKSKNYDPQQAWDNFYYYLLFHPKYLLWTLFHLDIFTIKDTLSLALKNQEKIVSLIVNDEQMHFIEENLSKIPEKSLLMILYASQTSIIKQNHSLAVIEANDVVFAHIKAANKS